MIANASLHNDKGLTTGEGILPPHYLLDDRRRPQLVTFGLIAWALTDIM